MGTFEVFSKFLSIILLLGEIAKDPDLGLIIGVVVGCVLLLTFAILCLLICPFKRKRRQTQSEDIEDQIAENVSESSTSKMNTPSILPPLPEMAVPKPMAAKSTFARQRWGPLPPITPQLDWMKEVGDSWKKKKKRKHKPEDVQTDEGQAISSNEDQTGETEAMNLFEIISTPDAVITESEKRSKRKIQERTTVCISTGDFTEKESTANSMKKNEYNPSTDDITNIDETRNSSNNIVNGETTEGACESSDIKAETKKKRKKKHRRHGEDRQDEETVQSLNRKSEKKKKKKKRQHETEMGDLLQKEFVQDNDRKEERKRKKHRKDEEDLLQSESVEDVDTKKDKRKKKKKKHRVDVVKELKDECVDDEVKGEENKRKQRKHPMDFEDVSQGESINDVDVIADFKKNLKDRTEIKDELNVGSSVILEEKMGNKNNTEKHENDNEKKLQCESIDGINIKPELKKKKKRKHRRGIFEEKTRNESAELGKEIQKEKRHDFLQRKQDVERKEESEIVLNGEEMDNDKAKGSTSLGDLANNISESEVVSSDDVAYRSEKKQKMKKKKKQPSQEAEREYTQTIDDIAELDVKRKKRKKRHRMAPIKQLDSSDEDVVMTRIKFHREGERDKTNANSKDHIVSLRLDNQSIEGNSPRSNTSEINKDISQIQVKPKITFVEVERTQGDFVQDTLKLNNMEQNIKTIEEGESFA